MMGRYGSRALIALAVLVSLALAPAFPVAASGGDPSPQPAYGVQGLSDPPTATATAIPDPGLASKTLYSQSITSGADTVSGGVATLGGADPGRMCPCGYNLFTYSMLDTGLTAPGHSPGRTASG